jgi:hypothetical protein
LPKRIPFSIAAGILLTLCLGSMMPGWAQEGPPPPPHPPGVRPEPPRLDERIVKERIQAVRNRLAQVRVTDKDAESLISTARRELGRAQEKLGENEVYAADRLQAAADAFGHAAEHSLHLGDGPKGPAPRPREIADHLQRVYFRLQQADFFARASGEPEAKPLPGLARKYYEEARKAYDGDDWFAADEYAKSADDTIRGLENLAQAAVPEPPPPPRPR